MDVREAGEKLYWISVDSIDQAGRETLKSKPKVITEGYLLLPDDKLQHALQVCDIDTVTPEALWIGSFQQAIHVITDYKKLTTIQCSMREVPHHLLKRESGKTKLNFAMLKNDFVTELMILAKGTDNNKEELINWDPPEVLKEDDERLQNTMAYYFLSPKNVKKMILSQSIRRSKFRVFYKKDKDDLSLTSDILDYKCFLTKSPVRLPEGWRYLCALNDYVDALHKELRKFAQSRGILNWSEKILDSILNRPFPFTDITVDLLYAIIVQTETEFENQIAMAEKENYSF